jgi:hypothetical protein
VGSFQHDKQYSLSPKGWLALYAMPDAIDKKIFAILEFFDDINLRFQATGAQALIPEWK